MAVHGASETIAASQHDLATAQVLNLRRAGVFDKAETVIPGAVWRDPAAAAIGPATCQGIENSSSFCVYSHEVGRETALRLRAQGVEARFLRCGIDGWQAAGRPVDSKQLGHDAQRSSASCGEPRRR